MYVKKYPPRITDEEEKISVFINIESGRIWGKKKLFHNWQNEGFGCDFGSFLNVFFSGPGE